MALSPYIVGAGSRATLLEIFAQEEQDTPPENFIGSEIFPDVEVPSFEGYAPITWNDTLEAYDDDTVGKRADYPEVDILQSEHEWGLGFHARKCIIDTHDRIKAQQQQAQSRTASDTLFNLEKRFTKILVGQNLRHAEILKMIELGDTTKYPAANVGASLAIDTATEATVLTAILTAATAVESAGKGPANMIVLGDGASKGAMKNPNLRALKGTLNGPTVFQPESLLPLMRLKEGEARARIATASYRLKKKAATVPMFDQKIWIGRVNMPNGKGDGFGANLWHPTLENSERYFVYRLVAGSQRNIHISVENFYQPYVNDYSLGYIIPTTVA